MKAAKKIITGLDNLLETAEDKSLDFLTRLYLVDGVSSMLLEMNDRQDSFFAGHQLPEKIHETDSFSLEQAVETSDMTSLYSRILHLQYGLWKEAETMQPPDLNSDVKKMTQEEFKWVRFLKDRENQVLATNRKLSSLEASVVLSGECAKDIYVSEAEHSIHLGLSLHEDAHIEKARTYFEKAKIDFGRAARVEHDDVKRAKYFGRAGLCSLYAKQYQHAISFATNALKESSLPPPLAAVAHLTIADAKRGLGQYVECLAETEKVAAFSQTFPETYAIRGDAFHKLQDIDEAAQNYGRCLSIINETAINELDFTEYCIAIRAERGLQKLGRSTSHKYEQEAIKYGYPKIMEVMKEYD